MQTSGCWLDRQSSQLALSLTPASVKLQTPLFWNFPARLPIGKAVISRLTHSMALLLGAEALMQAPWGSGAVLSHPVLRLATETGAAVSLAP